MSLGKVTRKEREVVVGPYISNRTDLWTSLRNDQPDHVGSHDRRERSLYTQHLCNLGDPHTFCPSDLAAQSFSRNTRSQLVSWQVSWTLVDFAATK